MKLVVCCLLAGLVTAAAGTSANSPTKYFAVVYWGSGSYSVDYGDDRLKPNVTTSFGVDGKASVTWSWTLHTVASRSGDKPVHNDRAILRGSYQMSGQIFSYTIQMGQLEEDPPACTTGGSHRTFDGKDRPANRGDWVKWNPGLTYDDAEVSFSARIPTSLAPGSVACYHSVFEGQEATNAYVPSGFDYPESAFVLRVGKSYEKTLDRSIDLPLRHDRLVDIAQLHTVRGEVQSAIRVTRISEDTWRKRAKEYRESPKFGIGTN